MKKSRLRDDEDDEEEYEERRPVKSSRAQKESDRNDLRMLATIYNILSILGCIMMVLVLIIFIVFGIIMIAGISSAGGGSASMVGLIPIGMGLFVALIQGVGVFLGFFLSKCYRERQHWTFCFVMACLSLPQVPLGTLLGIYALMVLNRPSVQKMFR
jgi:hypothetical protein